MKTIKEMLLKKREDLVLEIARRSRANTESAAQDIGDILNQEGVAIRAGHHCTMQLMQRFGLSATTRASLAAYNGRDDIDQLVAALHKVRKLLVR